MKKLLKRAIGRLERTGKLDWMSDKAYLQLMYWVRMDKRLNLKDPKSYNEKLQWIKLYDRKAEYSRMVDKYDAKQYIAEQIGSQYVIPSLGVWDRFDDIDFDSLPDQFVLKTTHDSGGVVICPDKSKLDMTAARKKLERSLKNNYYLHGREWPYKALKPRILAEKYMVDESGTELKDYKVMCFNGVAKLVQYHTGRFREHKQDYYDIQWNKLDIYQGCPLSDTAAEKPAFLEEMLVLSEKLAANIPHIRVDWYYVDGQLYLGELTFFDASGFDAFEPEQWDYTLGSWIQLPEKK